MSEQITDLSDAVAEMIDGDIGPVQPSDPGTAPGPESGSDSVRASDDRGTEEGSGVACLWRECGQHLPHTAALLEHIEQDHTAPAGSKYTCEWASCEGRGRQQPSRSALISHVRSHITKGAAAQCTECECTFERPDSLQRHMRTEHGQAGLRRSGRKRKRPNEDAGRPLSPNNHTLYAFRVDTGKPRGRPPRKHGPTPYPNATAGPSSRPMEYSFAQTPEGGYPPPPVDPPPPRSRYSREELERSPELIRYILMKAKHRYALEQNEALTNELELAQAELERQREEKDFALDKLLNDVFGAEAEAYLNPQEIKRAEEKVRARDGGPSLASLPPERESTERSSWHTSPADSLPSGAPR
ncbi:hypothetical protein HDZ31DRAFT_84160 [Schizophyllum fasciatum]